VAGGETRLKMETGLVTGRLDEDVKRWEVGGHDTWKTVETSSERHAGWRTEGKPMAAVIMLYQGLAEEWFWKC
jgi:hypothetical protein